MASKALLVCWILLLVVLPDARVRGDDTSVIIVGAGMSGIMAAKTLYEAGVKDVLILEATNVVGGRMRTHSFGGKRVELGANWIVGVNETTTNPIWKLAQQYNLQTYLSNLDNVSHNVYTRSGIVDPAISVPVFDNKAKEKKFVEELSLQKKAENGPDMSVEAAQRIYGKVPTSPVEMALDMLTYDFEFSERPRVTSLKHTQPNAIYNFGENIYMVYDQRGYSFLVEMLAAEFLSKEGPRLMLNTVARRIQHSPDGVTVETEDGKTYRSKFVIVSASLGVLQSGLIEFVPPLPDWKHEAISQFDMCVYTKIFLKFPYTFWPVGEGTEFFIYGDERQGYYPIWQQLENEFPGEHILFVTITDVEAKRVEKQPVWKTKHEMMDVLRNMFGSGIPEPLAIMVPKWLSNRFFAGTNSNWPAAVEEYHFKRLQAHVDSVYFAGEHTHALYKGYVHGAYYSGIDAANNVLECIFEGQCETVVPSKVQLERSVNGSPDISRW